MVLAFYIIYSIWCHIVHVFIWIYSLAIIWQLQNGGFYRVYSLTSPWHLYFIGFIYLSPHGIYKMIKFKLSNYYLFMQQGSYALYNMHQNIFMTHKVCANNLIILHCLRSSEINRWPRSNRIVKHKERPILYIFLYFP